MREPLERSDDAEQPLFSSLIPPLQQPSFVPQLHPDTALPATVRQTPTPAFSAGLASAWSYCGYSYLFSSTWATQYLLMQFEPQATSYFRMNPEAMAALALAPVVRLGLRLTIHRRFDTGQPLSIQRSVPLDGPARQVLDTALGTSGHDRLSISLPPFFPKFIRLPSVTQSTPIPLEGGAIDYWHTQQALTFERRFSPPSATVAGASSSDTAPLSPGAAAAASLSWWRLVQSRDDPSPFNATAGAGLRVVVASDWVFAGIGWNTAQQGGVLAFYGLIVYGAPEEPPDCSVWSYG
jgi:hypothetical protein